MRKLEMSQHRVPCRLRDRMNRAADVGIADAGAVLGAAAGGTDAVDEVESLGRGQTLYWM
jgi:hypothetical protein